LNSVLEAEREKAGFELDVEVTLLQRVYGV
jgi:hypothetical protein